MNTNVWSRFRLVSLIAASLGTMAFASIIVSTAAFRGQLPSDPIFWLVATITCTLWITFTAACVRDTLLARLDRLETTLLEYGDQREAAGEKAAAKYIHHTNTGRRLMPVGGTDDN